MMTLNRQERIQELRERLELLMQEQERLRAQIKYNAGRFNIISEVLSDLILEEK